MAPKSVIMHPFATLFYFSYLRWDDDDDNEDDDDNDNDDEDDDSETMITKITTPHIFFLVVHNRK